MESIVDDFLKKVLTPATVSQNPETTNRVREMILKTKPQGAAAALRAMAERPDQTDLLPEIIAPALVIVGSEDQLTPPSDAELMHKKIAGNEIVTIPETGHYTPFERPEDFLKIARPFLDRRRW